MEKQADNRIMRRILAGLVIACGIVFFIAVFARWVIKEPQPAPQHAAAVCSLVLFLIGCVRFVPGWIAFLIPSDRDDTPEIGKEPKYAMLAVAALAVTVEVLLYLLIDRMRVSRGGTESFEAALGFWRYPDGSHYLDIAREWYLSEGDRGRVVQLVFLPGYPLTVYPLYRILGNDLLAGVLVSALSFPTACCVLYRLLRLDYDHNHAFRAVVLLLLMPGVFFFLAPMSESLYLLLALSTLYAARKKHWLLAGLFGAYTAFTRTVGLLLVAPLILEWIHAFPKEKQARKRWILGIVPALMVPVGFLAYLHINRVVSGNPLQFLTYQSEHWGQRLGWFFNTAAYQTGYLIDNLREGSKELSFGLWLPNVVMHFGTLVLFALAAKKVRPSYAAWFIAYFVIAIGATWLLSAPRYLVSMPAVAMMLAAITDKRWKQLLAVIVLTPLSLLYLTAYVLRWQVW